MASYCADPMTLPGSSSSMLKHESNSRLCVLSSYTCETVLWLGVLLNQCRTPAGVLNSTDYHDPPNNRYSHSYESGFQH